MDLIKMILGAGAAAVFIASVAPQIQGGSWESFVAAGSLVASIKLISDAI